jgi:hypothetical protein
MEVSSGCWQGWDNCPGTVFPRAGGSWVDICHLARVAEVSPHSVGRFERGDSLRPSTIETIQGALEKAGVIFIDASDGGPGGRLG